MVSHHEFGPAIRRGPRHLQLSSKIRWPNGWPQLPPTYYAAHCVSQCVAILDGEAQSMSSFGSARIRDDFIARYGSPLAIESVHITLSNSDVCMRVYRSLFDTAR